VTTDSLLFRRVAGTQRLNIYTFTFVLMCTFRLPTTSAENLNSAAWLISAAKQQIPPLGSKFRGPRKKL